MRIGSNYFIIWVLVCIFLSTAPVYALQSPQPPKPVLKIDFAHGASAIGAASEKIPLQVIGNFILRNTPHGKAMVAGPGGATVRVPARSIVNAETGTVEMWVRTLDWNGKDQGKHVFFDARGQGVLYLLKTRGGRLVMMSGTYRNGKFTRAGSSVKNWKTGQWHFIAATWSPSSEALYVDGKLVSKKKYPNVRLPKRITGTIAIGDRAWGTSRESQSLVADVRIYDHALTPEHIEAHYKGNFKKVVPLSKVNPSLRYLHNVRKKKLRVTLNLNGADVDQSSRTQFSLKKGRNTVWQTTSNVKHGLARVYIPTGDLGVGTYKVVAKITSGQDHAQLEKKFVVPDLSWEGNSLGQKDKVLAPWTPMKTKRTKDGVNISCWGRTYQFHNSALPTQIISQQQAILASPVALEVLSDGKPLQWHNAHVNVLDASDTHVTLTGFAEAKTPRGSIQLRTNIRIAYDGVATLSLQLLKPSDWQPNKVSLVLPVNHQNSIYYTYYADGRDSPSGATPSGNGIVMHTNFTPFVWLGDNTRGLAWFCDTGEFWPNWSSKNAVQFVRDDGMVAIKLNLVKGQKLSDRWTFKCGIQATPVKQIPKDWRKLRIYPSHGNTVKILWPYSTTRNPEKFTEKHFGMPWPQSPVAYVSGIKQLHKEGLKAIPYYCLTFLSTDVPAYQWFKKQWNIDLHGARGHFDAVSVRNENLRDFLVWNAVQFMKKYPTDGWYYDQAMPYPSKIASTGYGWQDGNKRHPTYSIMANRKLYRRIYAVTKEQDPNAVIIAHMSGHLAIPFLGYTDAIVNGEQIRASHKLNDSYMDVMTLADWRAMFTCKQWGVIPIFLPGFKAKYRVHNPIPTRGLMALAVLHDVGVWHIWCNGKAYNKMYDALDKFGYVHSTFLPYWAPNPPASTNLKDVYVSAYKRKDGRALLIVGNTSQKIRKGTVTLNSKVLGLPLRKVYSWPDGKPVTCTDDKIKVSLRRLDYQLFLVGNLP